MRIVPIARYVNAKRVFVPNDKEVSERRQRKGKQTFSTAYSLMEI
jgi:hypothetical protein